MIIIGLTGSIGMGKSFTAQQFRKQGAGVFDADAAVHEILEQDEEAKSQIKKEFPAAAEKNKIDRKKLGDIVFASRQKLNILERIIHPKVWRREKEFYKFCRRNKVKIAVLDVPLLFETGSYRKCDYVVVVTASAIVQQKRVKGRENLNDEKFNQINRLQMPTSEKIKRADFVIHTGLDKRFVIKQVKRILNQVGKHA